MVTRPLQGLNGKKNRHPSENQWQRPHSPLCFTKCIVSSWLGRNLLLMSTELMQKLLPSQQGLKKQLLPNIRVRPN